MAFTGCRRVTAPLVEALADRVNAYISFLSKGSSRLPKQRGLQRALKLLDPKRRLRRPDTTARRLLPLLVVERQLDQSYDAQQAAREAKRAKKAEHVRKSRANDPGLKK